MNDIFLNAIQLDLPDLEAFQESQFSGVEELLKVSYQRLRIASSKDNEKIEEFYYFVEGNGTLKKEEENFLLYVLDDINFVLLDDCNYFYLIIRDNDLEEALLMLE